MKSFYFFTNVSGKRCAGLTRKEDPNTKHRSAYSNMLKALNKNDWYYSFILGFRGSEK